MRQINTGNILPFYGAVNRKSIDVYKPTIQHVVGANFRLVPFQIIVPIGDYVFDILTETGGFITEVPSSVISATQFSNTNLVAYTYNGGYDFAASLTFCTVYRVAVRPSGNGIYQYFSDFFVYKNDWNYQLVFTNTTDIGNVFYQNGYTQRLFFDGFEGVPLTDIVTKLDITLSGKELVTSSRQVEKRVITGHNFIDSQLSSIQRVEQHGTITLFEGTEISGVNIERMIIKHAPTPDDLHDVTFTFDVDISSQTGCGENKFIIL